MPIRLLEPTSQPKPDHRQRADRPNLDPQLEELARWMDSVFHIPGVGIRFGLDALIGLIPGVGDTLSSLVSLYILHAASRYGVPRITLLRMAANIGLDYVLGSIPLVGDMFDVFWKANQRNIALLRRHVTAGPVEQRKAKLGDRLFLAAVILVLVAALVGSVTITYFLIASLAHWITSVK